MLKNLGSPDGPETLENYHNQRLFINFFPSCEGVNSAKLVSVVFAEVDELNEAGHQFFGEQRKGRLLRD